MPISFIPYTAVYGPLSIPGCVFWLDAVDVNGTGTNPPVGNITTWKDKISGITLTATNADTLVASSANSLPGVRWNYNGGNGYGFTGTINSSYAITSGPIMVCCVVNYNNQASFANWFLAVNSAQVYIRQYQGNYWLAGVSGTTFASGTQLITAIYNGASSAFFVNGTQLFTGNPSTTQWTGIISVGSYWDGTTNNSMWSGDINEMITVSSTTNQQKLEGYLAQKWGLVSSLPANHPGRSQTLYNGKVYQPQISLKSAPYANYYPLSIGGCALWLDGADPAGNGIVPSAGNLAIWVDKSGGGINAIAGTAVYPQFNTSFLNGLGVVGLTNAADYFTVANNFNTPSLTYIFVMQPTSANTNNKCGLLSTDTAGQFGRSIALNNMVFEIEIYSTFLATSTTTNSSTWYIVSAVFNGTSSVTFSYNGTISTYAGSGTGTNSSGLTIGSYNSTSSYVSYNANFYLAEAIIFPTALPQSQFQQLEGYLAWKWGLQASLINTHPYYSAPPLQYTRGAILGAPTLQGISYKSYS